MALADEVQNRWSSQILVNASNPQDSTSTTLDTGATSRFTLAVTDVGAAFKIYAGVTYDNDVDTHVMVATEGVLVRLLLLTGQADMSHWDAWTSRLRDLGLVTSRDRILPFTDSLLTPTGDRPGDKPSFDRTVFRRGYIPNAPSSDVSTNNDGQVTTD